MSALHPQQQIAIPNRLKYVTPKISDYQDRKLTKIIPNNGTGNFLENSMISFNLPASSFYDLKNSYLSCNVQLTAKIANGDPIDTVLDNTSCPWISRVRIADGWNNTIEDITNYSDVVAVMEKLTTSKTFAEKSGQILDGTCPKTPAGLAIQKELAKNGSKKQIKLISGVFQSANLFPAQYTKGQISICVV